MKGEGWVEGEVEGVGVEGLAGELEECVVGWGEGTGSVAEEEGFVEAVEFVA